MELYLGASLLSAFSCCCGSDDPFSYQVFLAFGVWGISIKLHVLGMNMRKEQAHYLFILYIYVYISLDGGVGISGCQPALWSTFVQPNVH